MTKTAEQIARDVAALVGGDREKTHGSRRKNHQNIATMWNAFLSIRRAPAEPLSPADVATMMALLKIARTQYGAFNPDDHIDHVGYAAIAGQLASEENDAKEASTTVAQADKSPAKAAALQKDG